MLSNGSSFDFHKARFSAPVLLPQPTLKIKQAYSLATAKFRTRQSALPILLDNSRLLLRAEAPTRPPGFFILVFHLRNYPKSRRPSNSWLCLCGYPTSQELSLSSYAAFFASCQTVAKDIAISGHGMKADREMSAEAGFCHHLVKPIFPEKLDALLQEATTELKKKD
jgi:hypothetical protein